MILTCESCSTQFSVSAEALGPSGRRVKCSRCSHSWFQKPEETVPDAVAEVIAALDSEPKPEEQRPRPRPPVVIAKPPKQASAALKISAVAMLMIGAVLQTIAFLGSYKMGGNLLAGMGLGDSSAYQFTELSFESIPATPGKFTLALSGGVKNISDKEMPPWPVTITLSDMHGRTVSELAYPFSDAPSIGSGSTLPFQPKINNIPTSITRVTLELGNSLERSLR